MNSLHLANILSNNQELSAALNYDAVVDYINLVRCLKPSIALQEASYHPGPPNSLTVSWGAGLKFWQILPFIQSTLFVLKGHDRALGCATKRDNVT